MAKVSAATVIRAVIGANVCSVSLIAVRGDHSAVAERQSHCLQSECQSVAMGLPARFKAKRLAKLYRRRWRIENMFQRLESVLQSEVRTLGIPRAALLAFAVAVLAYNALTLMKTAVRVKHERTLKKTGMEISPYYIAVEVRANYGGMLIAVPDSAWRPFRSMSDKA